ncbi:MAG: TlpA family protein disulfide reductase, partial [Gammaproteobacteria bacterium]|nr:TlpA family protein disulfide reductase [Gammaproteobacteria bacterium]
VAILAAAAYVWLAPAGVQRAPDITVTTVEGRKIALEKLRGRPLLVTFWATTCPGCLKEMPHLIELYHDYAPRGFELVAIAMPYDPPNQVLAMVERKSIPYPVAL